MILLLWAVLAAAAAYQLLAIAACCRFLFRRDPEPSTDPLAVSVLKPLRGSDPDMLDALRTQTSQDHPDYEVLFGVADARDPAALAADSVKGGRVFVIDDKAPNGKVAILEGLSPQARHEVWVVNDSDISVASDYLRRVTSPLSDPRIGLVTCLYAAEASSFAARIEALGIATSFAPSVLSAPFAGVSEFALGSTLAFRTSTLRECGGFAAIRDYLADDYQLGKRIRSAGYRIHLSKVVVRTRLGGESWREVWKHQVRWARTVRVSRAGGYLGMPLANATPWAIAAAAGGLWKAAAALLALRYLMAILAGIGVLRCRVTAWLWPLTPVSDLFLLVVWAAGLRGSTVEWRGRRLRIGGGGRIVGDSSRGNPPLSYSLPAFRPGDYDRAPEWIERLVSLGFASVTFTPTFLVYDEAAPRIDLARSIPLTAIAAAMRQARAAGLRIRMEPHLDFEQTLTSGPHDWRNRMRLDPSGAYLRDVLEPLAAMQPDSLTLGSELGVSLNEFAEAWEMVRARLAGPIRLGHKITPDSLRARAPRRYLSQLDWVSVSFYPALRKWPRDTDALAKQFEKRLRRLAHRAPGDFAVGEMGIGSADPLRPWHFDESTLRGDAALATRRLYYLGMLEALRRAADLFGVEGAAFWTVTHFDVLGVMNPQWADAAVIEAVRDYNNVR